LMDCFPGACSSIFPTVRTLHLNNRFCLPVPQYRQYRYCLLLGETAILRLSAVYVSAAPLSAEQ
jgi:hypothetical protein